MIKVIKKFAKAEWKPTFWALIYCISACNLFAASSLLCFCFKSSKWLSCFFLRSKIWICMMEYSLQSHKRTCHANRMTTRWSIMSPVPQVLLISENEYLVFFVLVHQNWQQGSQFQPINDPSLAVFILLIISHNSEAEVNSKYSIMYNLPEQFFSLPRVPRFSSWTAASELQCQPLQKVSSQTA